MRSSTTARTAPAPLGGALRRAAARAQDPAVRRWLLALSRGEGASGTAGAEKRQVESEKG